MRRLLPLTLLTSLLLALGAGSAQAAPLPGVSVVGVTAGTAETTRDFDQAKALGAKLVRLELPWRWLEPTAAGQRDPAALATLDATMQAARSRGLKVVLLIDQTPCWTSTAPAEVRDACGPGYDAYPPADNGAFGAVSAFVAARYATTLAALEVWNEPDQSNERYWAGPDKAAHYAALLKAAYPAVKRAAPKVPVLAGALVGTNGRFLEALYKAGIKGSYDGISLHFYTAPLAGLRITRALQRRYGDRKSLWLLEAGWNSCKPAKEGTEGQRCVTNNIQARNFRDLFAQTKHTSYLRALVIYSLRDSPADRFGVLSAAGIRKPSWTALKSVFRRVGAVRRPTLKVRARGGQLIATGTGPDGDAYRIKVSSPAGTFSATFYVDAYNRFRLALPPQLGTRGAKVSVRSLWAGSKTVTRRH
jgi:hypothetical protein